MSFRWSAFVGAALVALPASAVLAEMHGIPLSDTIYVKWSGALDQETLADESVLSEYVAQTYSETVNGASVQIAFLPRFNCSPVFSVLLNAESAAAISGDLAIRLTVDGVDREFPALVDLTETSLQYSYDGNREDQQRLRELLDISSRMSMSWISTQEDSAEDKDVSDPFTVTFSLLGSRMSAQAVEALCKAHEPIPY